MNANWVAGTVRARALARRRVGAANARRLAAAPSLGVAIQTLADTPYGHDVRSEHGLADADRAIGATLLWHLRVLAGWLPGRGVEPVRVLAGWFELANIDELMRSFTGAPAAAPYRLGALATAWPRLARSATPASLRDALAASAWADPGSTEAGHIGLALRIGWAQRVAGQVPGARAWAAGGLALELAQARFAAGRTLEPPLAERAATLIGRDAVRAASLDDFVARLGSDARWALADAADDELWRAEARWWGRLERDGLGLLNRARFELPAVLGAIAVLAVDAWRVRAALACAARAGGEEAFDALG